MKNLDIIRKIVESAEQFTNEETEKSLYTGVKETTEKLIKANSKIKLEEIFDNLRTSTYVSAVKMLYSDDFDASVNLLLDIAKGTVGELEETEATIFQAYFKFLLVSQMVHKSHQTALKAVKEAWNGMKGME